MAANPRIMWLSTSVGEVCDEHCLSVVFDGIRDGAIVSPKNVTEAQIRNLVRKELQALHADDPSTRILDEFSVCDGESRVDIAVINSKLDGFEIKSWSDNLNRLSSQIKSYSMVFDTVSVVAAPNHTEAVMDSTPWWVGVYEVVTDDELTCLRRQDDNPDRNPLSVAQLLWKDELLTLLAASGFTKLSRKTRRQLWELAACELDDLALYESVRNTIKARSNWRVD